MKKINIIFLLMFFLFIVYSLLNIKETNFTTMNVLTTFSKTILPALLPFLILNQLAIKLGIIDILAYFIQFISYPLFKISGKGASVIIIGLLNGFPSSAIFTSLLVKDKQLEKKEAQRLINSIFFPSISFLFVIINSNLKDNLLFTYLILGLYITGFTSLYLSSFKESQNNPYISLKETKDNIKIKLNSFLLSKDIKETINYTINTLLNILGIIIIFSIPCNILNKLISNNYSYLFKGLIEFSIPSIKLSLLNTNKKINTILLGTILSFSSLSSIMQATLFINEVKLDSYKFIVYRVILAISTAFLISLFLFFL